MKSRAFYSVIKKAARQPLIIALQPMRDDMSNPLEQKIQNLCAKTCPYFLFTFLILVLIEIGSFTALKLYGELRLNDGRNPTQYSDQTLISLYPGWSPEDARSMLQEVWLKRPLHYEPLVEYSEAPFSGQYVNVSQEGFRKIKNQQPLDSSDSVKVFVFGGSTTFGSGLPDWETVPSFLQEALRKNDPATNYSVFNFGVGYYYSTLERIRFEKLLTAGIKPDIAIFIDGLNDFSFYHIPDRSAQSEFLRHRFSANALSLGLHESFSFKLAHKLMKRAFSSNVRAAATTEDLKHAAMRLKTNWEILDAIGKRLGINVVRVLQPLSFAGDFPDSPVLVDPAYDMQIELVRKDVREGYQLFKELSSKKDKEALLLADFTINENQFVDYVHYNSSFSKAIATEIAKHLDRLKGISLSKG